MQRKPKGKRKRTQKNSNFNPGPAPGFYFRKIRYLCYPLNYLFNNVSFCCVVVWGQAKAPSVYE